MKRARFWLAGLVFILALGACDDDVFYYGEQDYPAAPLNLAGWYYDQAVYLTW